MKFKLQSILYILILGTFFGCQNDQNIQGNYSVCENGEYTEVYFKKDSMRIAADNDWVKLSKWRKIEIKNDTLYFETFGEWRDSLKAEIKYAGMNTIELRILKSGENLNLIHIDENINFEKPKEFWSGFHNRQHLKNCK
ncbi:hypothetical protein [Aquimarina sp. Aq78]|uniref:hypothetical protein n=2 Tax=Aquimarina sp. Aq78 TaxID=1191889 RepID=UPI000D10FE24|nr:hypothetical protein [Aquimarina sp. Aq78]